MNRDEPTSSAETAGPRAIADRRADRGVADQARRAQSRRASTDAGAELEDRWRRAARRPRQHAQAVRRRVGRQRRRNEPGWPRQWLPVAGQPRARPRARRRRPGRRRRGRAGGPRPGPGGASPGSGSRGTDEPGVPFDPARHEAVGVVEPASTDAEPGTVVAGGPAGLRRRPSGSSGRRPWWWRTQGRVMPPRPAATSTRCSACRGRRARRRSSGPTGSWPAPTTPTSTRTRRPRIGSRRSPRRTTSCPTPTPRARYDAFGPDFRQVPEGVEPQTGRRAASAARAGVGRGPVRAAGRRGGSGRRRWRRSADRASAATSRPRGPARRHVRRPAASRRGPMPGADQEAELELTVEEAYRGGRAHDHPRRSGRPRTLDVNIPAGVTDGQRIRLAGAGRHGHRRWRRAGDLYLVVRIAPHPALPGRGPRHLRRPAARPVGGGARRDGRGRHAGRRGQGERAAGHLERPAAAAARPRHAQSARAAGRPLRRGRASWCRRR